MNNQQAIDRLVKHLEWGWSEETVDAIKMGIHALKETQWIPCGERLPEHGKYVLISCEGFDTPTVVKYEEDDIGGTFYLSEDAPCEDFGIVVEAWRPLPEPYKESRKWTRKNMTK